MSSLTPNLSLILPIGQEYVSRSVFNGNMTLIDTAYGTLDDKIENTGSTTFSSLSDLKTYLISQASALGVNSARRLTVVTSFSGSPFGNGVAYSGWLQTTGNVNYFSIVFNADNGQIVHCGYANGTWTIQRVTKTGASNLSSILSSDSTNQVAITIYDNPSNPTHMYVLGANTTGATLYEFTNNQWVKIWGLSDTFMEGTVQLYHGVPTLGTTIQFSDFIKNYRFIKVVNASLNYDECVVPVTAETNSILTHGHTYLPDLNLMVLWEIALSTSDGKNFYVARDSQCNLSANGVDYLTGDSTSDFYIYGIK